jgi:hypothetical protein
MENALTIGKGEDLLSLETRRISKGLLVRAKAHPAIEDTFRNWSGNGAQVLANSHGRFWLPHGEGKLMAWGLTEVIPRGAVDRTANYGVDRLGTLLLEGESVALDRGDGRRLELEGNGKLLVNLGFLRLVGIGDAPVEFLVRGVFTTEGIAQMSSLIHAATRKFVMDYLRPVEIKFVISTQ